MTERERVKECCHSLRMIWRSDVCWSWPTSRACPERGRAHPSRYSNNAVKKLKGVAKLRGDGKSWNIQEVVSYPIHYSISMVWWAMGIVVWCNIIPLHLLTRSAFSTRSLISSCIISSSSSASASTWASLLLNASGKKQHLVCELLEMFLGKRAEEDCTITVSVYKPPFQLKMNSTKVQNPRRNS